jgi:hypothetical protein
VPVIRMGDFSTELCGGTGTCSAPATIGVVRIRSEGGVGPPACAASTAASGRGGARARFRQHEEVLRNVSTLPARRDTRSACPPSSRRLLGAAARDPHLEKRITELQQGKARRGASRDPPRRRAAGSTGSPWLATRVEGLDAQGACATWPNRLRDRIKSGVPSSGAAVGRARRCFCSRRRQPRTLTEPLLPTPARSSPTWRRSSAGQGGRPAGLRAAAGGKEPAARLDRGARAADELSSAPETVELGRGCRPTCGAAPSIDDPRLIPRAPRPQARPST